MVVPGSTATVTELEIKKKSTENFLVLPGTEHLSTSLRLAVFPFNYYRSNAPGKMKPVRVVGHAGI
jgi:hypothetical protein